jgi:hypothetical protein
MPFPLQSGWEPLVISIRSSTPFRLQSAAGARSPAVETTARAMHWPPMVPAFLMPSVSRSLCR